MATSYVSLISPYFPDPKVGRPIFFGSVYIGEPNLDPEILANRKTVTIQQQDGTDVIILPAAQPLTTGAGGVILYNGSAISSVTTEDNYSLKVLNNLGAEVYYIENALLGIPITQDVVTQSIASTATLKFDTLTDLKAALLDDADYIGGFALTGGYNVLSDGGANLYRIQAITATPDNGGSLIKSAGNVALEFVGLFPFGNGSPEQWGTIGDGVTNDIVPLQAYFDTAPADGFEIILTPGKQYYIEGTLTTGPVDNKKSSVTGYGARIIQGTANTTTLNIRNSNSVIRGIDFRNDPALAQNKAESAIDILDVTNVVVSQCIFQSLVTSGIKVRTSGVNCNDVRITDCSFEEVQGNSIVVFSESLTFVNRVIIKGNTFDSPPTPIDAQTRAVHIVNNVNDVEISNNMATGNANSSYTIGWRDCIQIGNSSASDQPARIVIANNSLTGMGDDNIGISGATSVTITGNQLYNSIVTSGIYVPGNGTWFNDDITITGNVINNCALAGIFLKDTKNYTITGNLIRNCQSGIFINDNGVGILSGTINSNTILDVETFGIHWDGGSCSVVGNMIDTFGTNSGGATSNESGIFTDANLSDSSVVGNTIKNGINGILLNNAPSDFVVSQNVVTGSSGYGIYFLAFAGDNYIIANNRLNASLGDFVNQPAPSPTQIFDNNL